MITNEIARVPASRSIALDIAHFIDAEVTPQGAISAGRPMVRMSRDRLVHLLEVAAQKAIDTTTAHFHCVDAARQTPDARFRRGLFRLWCALSIIWIAFSVVAVGQDLRGQPDFVRMGLVCIGLPLTALVVSVALIKVGIWVWNGFRGGP